MKPYEVEILVGEVADDGGRNEIYHVLFDGTVTDEHEHVAIGGHAEELSTAVQRRVPARVGPARRRCARP